jgi:hypothetical protein
VSYALGDRLANGVAVVDLEDHRLILLHVAEPEERLIRVVDRGVDLTGPILVDEVRALSMLCIL